MRTSVRFVLPALCLVAGAFLMTGCATIAGGHRIPDGAAKSRGYSSIAGDVVVGRGATVRNVKTVAGEIDIAEGSRVGRLTSVAGNIRVAPDVQVRGSIKTVAGDIEVERGCTVAGDVGTIAGRIWIAGSLVKGDVSLRGGGLDLTHTRVTGVVRVRPPKDNDQDGAEITIGPDSEVAAVTVERDSRARLRIHRSARVGSLDGIEAVYFQ